MDWRDRGIVLAVRPLGERDAVLSLFTRDHGRHPGLVRGGAGRRLTPLLQPGNELHAVWRARLSDHLGTYGLEPGAAHGAQALDSARKLAALSAVCAVLETALPEREVHARLFDGLEVFLQVLAADGPYAALLVRLELEVLADLGFGLDLGACAVTGATAGLTHVSPRTGRAVSAAAAAPYGDRLLRLPAFLAGGGAADPGEIADGLALTGHFLERHVLAPQGRGLPAARIRLASLLGSGPAIC
ncbi:DNA repair protein RecO [Zavarzinia compransoris]|uniref:DNA repair protein RecO n=1 Tax=Zavarzinia compransoris TaxID=1264899 RepID=A0A317EBH9_9PROT|nr:DNA repair protein RecO [Zavarzinia compransoris]PWR23586.1 DNA repair protein RecO [Zavarzinia compransoris]TDP47803.1 DNA replication and repair protein RecO [Zavarzinia compransoris]